MTVTHTIGVIALGLVTLFASRYILPEDLFPWINLVAALLRGRHRGLGGRSSAAPALGRRPRPRPGAGPRHAHDHARPRAAPAVGRSGPRADDGHHARTHGHVITPTATTTGTATGTTTAHHHGPGGHTHAPPEDLSMRSLLAVGASAGIIPCPSALVLLLGAIALDRVGYGLVLVLAFSLGLAGLLSIIGLLVLYARRCVERLPLDGRFAAAAPGAVGARHRRAGHRADRARPPGVL